MASAARASGAAQAPSGLPATPGRAPRPRAPTLPRMRSTRSRSRPLAATGVVAAITMFLAREPLIDLAGKLVDGLRPKRSQEASRARPEEEQDADGDSPMTDRRHDRRQGSRETARQRAIEAYDSARDSVAGAGRHAADTLERSAADRACRRARRGRADRRAAAAHRRPRPRRSGRPHAACARPPRPRSMPRATPAASASTSSASAARRARRPSAPCFEGVTDAAKASGQAALDAAKNQR